MSEDGGSEATPGPDAGAEPVSGDDSGAGPTLAERLDARVSQLLRRLRRVERRGAGEFVRWIENTDNLVHLSALVFVPVVVAVVTGLSNSLALFSFLLFPPLASGTYTLFANPEGKYADPVRFVVGLTAGAACGWLALTLIDLVAPERAAAVSPGAAAFSILLAGGVTWALDVEEPSAFSAALLVLAAPGRAELYVLFTLGGSLFVAVVFTAWRRAFYERRAALLYGTVRGDDHVLVPMRGDTAAETAMLAARLAAAHEAGKVVLLDVVSDERAAAAAAGDGSTEGEPAGDAAAAAPPVEDGTGEPPSTETAAGDADVESGVRDRAARAAVDLEATADGIRETVGVPCEVVVAAGDPGPTVRTAVRETNCDLIVTPYDGEDGDLSAFTRSVFRGSTDSVLFRSTTGRRGWRRVLVLVSRPGDSAHAMVDFASRLAGTAGGVSVCTCIDREAERRSAEERLANVVETADGAAETRVARSDVLEFVAANAGAYDLVLVGSSSDRSAASRAVSPPTFGRLRDVDCDVAVVDRADVE